ncbi:MAG: hypothetical protein ACT4NX_08725 [Deltaproteobacteria bacterium]
MSSRETHRITGVLGSAPRCQEAGGLFDKITASLIIKTEIASQAS